MTGSESLQVPDQKRITDELYWLIPIGVAGVGVAVFLLSNRSWGADVAGILTLPVEVAGIAIAILIAKGAQARGPAVPRHNRRFVAAAIAILTVLVTGVVYLVEREPDPFDFLAGNVRIGYVEPGYPGWNEGVSLTRTGFDVAVARALLDYFPDMESIQWVPLSTLDERLTALEGEWGDDDLEPVKLVISNFSITESRKRRIDFAGPYFNDAEGFATHQRGQVTLYDVKKACVPAGSTAEERLRKLKIAPVVEPTVQACFQRFFRDDDPALTVSTDLSIVQAFTKALPAAKQAEVPQFITIATEQYGIGMPNNSPKLCAKVSEALDRYMELGWQTDFDETLGKFGVTANVAKPRINHNPQGTEPCEPAAPWRK